MIRPNPSGDQPQISQSAFIDPTAIICGKVIIEDSVFVGPYAVIRADEINAQGTMMPIRIGANSNIQDGVVIHSVAGAEVSIGECCSIAHRSIVHGPCQIANNVFVGFNSVVFRSFVGDNCVIRHNAVIDGIDIPANCHVPPLSRIENEDDLNKLGNLSDPQKEFSKAVVAANKYLSDGYQKIYDEL
ncbi:MAG: hypothetical protein OIF51_18010 [Cellvibrionaceae bacterium]|nr:hypothetical protein [Cellvibrionaceae bacterium]